MDWRIFGSFSPVFARYGALWGLLIVGLPAAAAPPEARIRVDAATDLGPMPNLAACLSQADVFPAHTDAVRDRFRELGVRYVRQDHLLEAIVEGVEDGELRINWEPLDRRLEFIRSFGAEPIMCLSYMPGVLAATEDNSVIRPPGDFGLWEELVFQVAHRYNAERGYGIRYWEVWNEPNSNGFWRAVAPESGLEAYLRLYEASVRGVRRADPGALIGGPGLAGGPVQDAAYGDYGGEDFVRGLIRFCAEEGLPLDFVSWHEYWWPVQQFVFEAKRMRELLAEFPSVGCGELMITEWNQSWGFTDAHDSEAGAAWAANTLAKGIFAAGIDKACFFLGQDHGSDRRFRGYWGLLAHDGTPKAAYNAMRMFAMLGGGRRLRTTAEEDAWWRHDIGVLAARGPDAGRVAVLIWRNGPGGEDLSFTVRWEGTIRIPAAGEYVFRLSFDDGVRFRLGEELLLDDWGPGAKDREVRVALREGAQPIRIEYREGGGDARVRLRWEGPGIGEQPVPEAALSFGGEPGLRGSYYLGRSFEELVMQRTDPGVDFDWGGRSPFSDARSTEEALRVEVVLENGPGGPLRARRYLVDREHSNAYRNPERAELETAAEFVQDAGGRVSFDAAPYMITLVELRAGGEGGGEEEGVETDE